VDVCFCLWLVMVQEHNIRKTSFLSTYIIHLALVWVFWVHSCPFLPPIFLFAGGTWEWWVVHGELRDKPIDWQSCTMVWLSPCPLWFGKVLRLIPLGGELRGDLQRWCSVCYPAFKMFFTSKFLVIYCFFC
jgi:hypothetical protein